MDTQNLFFFTGENTFGLCEELRRWKSSFGAKHGAENLHTMAGKSLTVSDLLDAVSVMPFIAEKRLVIVEGVPKIEREELESVLDSLHPQTVLLIVDSKPDKRLNIVKDLKKHADHRVFPSLSQPKLLAWIRERFAALGATISPDALSALVSMVGTDQWMLDAEISKLAIVGGEVRAPMVESLAVPAGMQVVWKLTDLIGSGKAIEALQFLRHRLDRGEDPYGIWTILLNTIKNLTLVHAGLQEGLKSESDLASAFAMHPFAVRGLLPLATSMTPQRMKELVDWTVTMDRELKTGGYHYTAERQEEVIALSERAILMCA